MEILTVPRLRLQVSPLRLSAQNRAPTDANAKAEATAPLKLG